MAAPGTISFGEEALCKVFHAENALMQEDYKEAQVKLNFTDRVAQKRKGIFLRSRSDSLSISSQMNNLNTDSPFVCTQFIEKIYKNFNGKIPKNYIRIMALDALEKGTDSDSWIKTFEDRFSKINCLLKKVEKDESLNTSVGWFASKFFGKGKMKKITERKIEDLAALGTDLSFSEVKEIANQFINWKLKKPWLWGSYSSFSFNIQEADWGFLKKGFTGEIESQIKSYEEYLQKNNLKRKDCNNGPLFDMERYRNLL